MKQIYYKASCSSVTSFINADWQAPTETFTSFGGTGDKFGDQLGTCLAAHT